MGFLSRSFVSSICALALVGSFGLVGAASSKASSARISAHLTLQVFEKAQANTVKVIYTFSAPSKTFAYRLTLKKGSEWQTVKSVKKTGIFKGSHTMTVKKVFGGKAIKAGAAYRLKLSADGGSKLLRFAVLPDYREPTPTGSEPENTLLPTISGTARQGQTLTAFRGYWSNSPTEYTFSWERCSGTSTLCTDIPGGFYGSTYTVSSWDVGYSIRVTVEARNAYGWADATSNQTAVVTA